MHIEKYRSNGIDYLHLVEGKRMKIKDGSPIVGKRVVASIGAYARHDDGRPDYLSRLRQSFRDGKPLIDALKPYVGDVPKEEWGVRFKAGDPKCNGETKRLAARILDPVFSALGLDQLFASVKHASKIQYDLQGIVRLLVYGRMLEPASKCATMNQNGNHFEPLVGSSNPRQRVRCADGDGRERGEDLPQDEHVREARHRAQPLDGVLRRDELLLRDRRGRRGRGRRGREHVAVRAQEVRCQQGEQKATHRADRAFHGRQRHPDIVRDVSGEHTRPPHAEAGHEEDRGHVRARALHNGNERSQ